VTLVLDSSVTLAWFFRDEQTERSVRFSDSQRSGAVVPRSGGSRSRTRSRRRSVGPDRRRLSRRLDRHLAIMDIVVDAESDRQVWSTTLNLADRFRLTLYDAVYLELAHRLALPLASLDPSCARPQAGSVSHCSGYEPYASAPSSRASDPP